MIWNQYYNDFHVNINLHLHYFALWCVDPESCLLSLEFWWCCSKGHFRNVIKFNAQIFVKYLFTNYLIHLFQVIVFQKSGRTNIMACPTWQHRRYAVRILTTCIEIQLFVTRHQTNFCAIDIITIQKFVWCFVESFCHIQEQASQKVKSNPRGVLLTWYIFSTCLCVFVEAA